MFEARNPTLNFIFHKLKVTFFAWSLVLASSFAAQTEEFPSAQEILTRGEILNSAIVKTRYFGTASIWWVKFNGAVYYCFADRYTFNCVTLDENATYVLEE